MPYSARLCTALHVTHQSRLHWRSLELDTGLDSISRLTNRLLLDVHFLTYPPDCLQCVGMICKCGIGGPRSTTSVSTPTTQPPVTTYSPGDKMALQAGRLGLSHLGWPLSHRVH